MRPRGQTQRRYNEAIQLLTSKQVKKHILSPKLSVMKSMAVKRREGCPQTVLHIWDAIAYIRQQRQIPNWERLSSYMKRVYNLNQSDLEKELNFAINDGLIIVKKTIGCKGSKVGVEQDGYRAPEEIKERDGHDWYCFECHRGGEMILCTTCHRVYHEDCLGENVKTPNFVCPVCKQNHERFDLTLKKTELNILLGFTCIRLKEKTQALHRIPHPDEEKWRYNFLVYSHLDLVAMEDKMKSNEYSRLGDFFTDAQQVVHNVIVYFGIDSRIADMARQMLGDCEYDLLEIMQCRNCYKMSNMKHDNLWFCQPCNPPHELVYAKVKGFPYWPAKVIKKEDNMVDVRFFGSYHQRALVTEDYVKPISTSFQQLNIKKTPSFDRAYKEMRHHQELVEASLRGRSSLTKLQSEKNSDSTKKENDSVMDNSLSSSKPKLSNPRKRKSAPVTPMKPINNKRPASVPVKKNKKFYQESPTSTSPKNTSQDISVVEDHNIVTSSSQYTSIFYVSVGVQTSDELLPMEIDTQDKTDDVGKNETLKKPCECSTKYEKLLKELHARLEEEHKADKAKALKEFSEKIRVEMEAERQKSLTTAIEKLQFEHKELQRKAEEQRKISHQQELKKLLEQHSNEISDIKKKQWCYNCEAEAIYHCCWNTSYCSVECQQVHWHKEHKRTCRRKR